MKVAGKRIQMARFVKDPMIGVKPKQAFMFSNSEHNGWEAYMTEHEGVYIKTDKGAEHYVGAGNIESIRFYPDQAEEKRGPGRPRSGAV